MTAPNSARASSPAPMSASVSTPRSAPSVSPDVQQLIQDLRAYEQVALVTRRHFDATITLDRELAQHTAQQFDAQRATMTARADFATTLHAVYRTPSDALRQFERETEWRGEAAVLHTLTTRPETYGPLQRDAQRGWRRWFPQHAAEEPARHAAHRAATAAVTMFEAQARARVAPMMPTTLREANTAVERHRTMLHMLPEKAALERRIATRLQHLSPGEVRQAEHGLSNPQAALLHTFKASVREIMMGTERER